MFHAGNTDYQCLMQSRLCIHTRCIWDLEENTQLTILPQLQHSLKEGPRVEGPRRASPGIRLLWVRHHIQLPPGQVESWQARSLFEAPCNGLLSTSRLHITVVKVQSYHGKPGQL